MRIKKILKSLVIPTQHYQLRILKSDIDIKKINEEAIHKYIISLLEDKFLEHWTGFALVGHEYKIVIGNNTYHIDLLFFNTELNS